MKKQLLSLIVLATIGFTASAQTAEVKTNDKKVKVENDDAKTKVKKTSTPGQKVHNIVYHKHKRYSGVKVKHEAKKAG